MKKILNFGVLGALMLLCTGSAFATYLNLTGGALPHGDGTTTIGGFTNSAGAGFTQTTYLDTRAITSSVGSGVIDSFVRIGAGGPDGQQIEGFNTSFRPAPLDDDNTLQFTHDIKVGDLLTFNGIPGVAGTVGTTFVRFVLDINQQGADPLYTLNSIKIATSATGFQPTFPGAGTLVVDIDAAGAACLGAPLPAACTTTDPFGSSETFSGNGALLNYNLNSGSGNTFDMFFWVPKAVLGADTNFVYLYSHFGGADGGDYVNNDGYEEWAREVPEPGFYGLLALGLGGLYMAVSRRRKASV
jgi:hypothetical protein